MLQLESTNGGTKHRSYLVGACLSAALLAACGSSSNRFYPSTSMSGAPQPHLGHYVANASNSMAPNAKLQGEVLTASDVSVKHLDGFNAKFAANGDAKGPYPGTFVATGSWGYNIVANLRGFGESFTITSKARKISGTIAGGGSGLGPGQTGYTFGPVSKRGYLKYTYRSWSGPVTTNQIRAGSLSEMLGR